MHAAERLTCRECHRHKPGNYFISPTLCKKCAAKRRPKRDNPLIKTPDGLSITTAAFTRLEKKADSVTPRTLAWRLRMPAFAFVYLVGLVLYVAYVWPLGNGHGFIVGFVLVLGSIAPAFAGAWLLGALEAPRLGALTKETARLAQERQRATEEAERFYASPEWAALRREVIEAHGATCALCYMKIRRADDLTVDHIKPRSRFPELALEFSNCQVLCRSCNSSKGART